VNDIVLADRGRTNSQTRVEVLNKIGNREPKHLVSDMPQSYRGIQRDGRGRTFVATDSLFIIGAWVVLRRLEIIPVVGQAAVGENPLPNSLRLNLRKLWQYVNCKAGAGRRRAGRGASRGRHGRENSELSGVLAGLNDKRGRK